MKEKSMYQEDTIKKILEFGILAPSGENSQPWRFVVRENEIKIFNVPERDQSLYNWDQRASYFAHGALLENMAIAGETFGYTSSVQLFPNEKDHSYTARITLKPAKAQEHHLFSALIKRVTNRKVYASTPLTAQQTLAIQEAGKNRGGVRAVLIEDPTKREVVARAAAVNEEILFGNKAMHDFFFNHVSWTKAEDDRKSIGFFIKTLELPPPANVIFKLIRRWSIARALARLGLPRKISAENAKVYSSGAVSGAVVIPDSSEESFMHAGGLMERIWLTATNLGLSIQPMAGITFLMLGITHNKTNKLTTEEIRKVEDAYRELAQVFGVTSGIIPMVFRIGHGGSPSARASRLPPKVLFE